MDRWVKSAKAGEQNAWKILYQQYYPSLFATALRICPDPASARDAVQESFTTAFLKLSQLRDEAIFGAWIKKILIRTCYRSLNRLPLLPLPMEKESWWDNEMEKKLDQLSLYDHLYAALSSIPETLRMSLLLRYFTSFNTYGEMASILGVPVGTIRSRLHQAKLKLAELWQQHPADDKKAREVEEWNAFYFSLFARLHHDDDCKNKFMNHLHNDARIVIPGGITVSGRKVFEGKIMDDRKHGSWMLPSNVMSAGNISIIETRHFNSPEFPDHCPDSSVLVLYREKGKVNRMNLHPSA